VRTPADGVTSEMQTQTRLALSDPHGTGQKGYLDFDLLRRIVDDVVQDMRGLGEVEVALQRTVKSSPFFRRRSTSSDELSQEYYQKT